MKSSTLHAGTVDFSSHSTPSSEGLLAPLRRAVAAFKQARAERHMRYDLAELDDCLLRDIGVASDEIHRVRAHEVFTPRNWRE